jgi:hypothetical protein
MRKIAHQWFTSNTQQAVMSKVAVLPVIARTGPSNRKTSIAVKTENPEDNIFIVGESEVGGKDRVGL